MPRPPRIPSPTGIYHVMLRGINRRKIFLDDLDFMKMEKILRQLTHPKTKSGEEMPPVCKIFAYCLMTNHIHLLIAETDKSISEVIKSLGVSYVSYFNKRRERTGTLFEGRFRSEPVCDIQYFTTLINYIHYNPVKAGLTTQPGWYKWSSWHEYELPDEMLKYSICEQNLPFKSLTREELKAIVLKNEEPTSFISHVEKKKYSDEEAEALLRSLLPNNQKDADLKKLPKVDKITLAAKCKDYGIKAYQIRNLIGLSESTIYRGRLKMTRSLK